jgi:hypothetical protein
MVRTLGLASLFALLLARPVVGQEYKVEPVDTPPPADVIAPEIGGLIAPTGFKLVKGDSRTIAELWLVKQLPLAADAKTGPEVLYPLTPGQLVGVVRYPRKGADFRDQDIPAGLYTMRYGQQPVDGAHVGTSPTRDFLLLLPAEKDREAKPLDHKAQVAISIETTGTAHPAILSLQRPAESGEPLSVREDSEKEWVIVRFVANSEQGGAKKSLPLEMVVVGVAAE